MGLAASGVSTGARGREDCQGPTGFTLLEILVVLAILGLLMVGLGGGLRLAARAWELQSRAVAERAEIGPLQQALYELVLNSRTVIGGSQRLELVTLLPRALGASGLHEVIVHNAAETSLRIAWRPYSRSAIVPPAWQETVATSAAPLAFSYFKARDRLADPSEPWGWQSSWTTQSAMPRLVRIELVPAGGMGDTLQPGLVVAPRTQEALPQATRPTDRRRPAPMPNRQAVTPRP